MFNIAAIYYYDLTILTRVARILNKPLVEERFRALSLQVRKLYNNRFLNEETGQYGTRSQTANAMPVYTGLVDPANQQVVASSGAIKIIGYQDGKILLQVGSWNYFFTVRS